MHELATGTSGTCRASCIPRSTNRSTSRAGGPPSPASRAGRLVSAADRLRLRDERRELIRGEELVRLEVGEPAGAGDGEAHRGGGHGVRHLRDDEAVLWTEHTGQRL